MERTNSGSSEPKRKSSGIHSSEKPQGVGPSGGGETDVRKKRRENGDAPVETGATGRDIASSSGAAAATQEQEAGVAGFSVGHIDPFMTELQRIKLLEEDLDRQRGFMKMQLTKKMEEELEKIRRQFEEKVKEEEGRYRQERTHLGDTYQKLLRHKSLAQEELDKFIRHTGLFASASTSGSSQVPKQRQQLGPQPCPPQPIRRAVAPAPAPAPALVPAAVPLPATATGKAPLTGGQSGSVVGPHITSISSYRPPAATSASTASLWSRPPAGTVLPHRTPALASIHRASEAYRSQPHLSELLGTLTPVPVPSTSSQRFAPSAGTHLRHPSLSAPYHDFFGPHLSADPAWRPPAPGASNPSRRFASSARTYLWHLGLLPGATPRAPEPHLPSSRPHPSVLAATSTPGPVLSVSTAFQRPFPGSLLPYPTPAPGAVLLAPARHLICFWRYPSAIPGTSTPRMPVGPTAHVQSQVQFQSRESLLGPSVSSGLRSAVPNNGNTNFGTAGTSTSRNVGRRNDGTGSGAGQLTVNEDGVVCLSDDD